MKEKIDFSECPLYDDPACFGQNPDGLAQASGSQVVFVKDGKEHSSDAFDFIRDYKCAECPQNKKAILD